MTIIVSVAGVASVICLLVQAVITGPGCPGSGTCRRFIQSEMTGHFQQLGGSPFMEKVPGSLTREF